MAREGTNLIQQIGVQSVAGTSVAATKRLTSLGINLGLDIVTKQFRSHGAKANTSSIVHKIMSSGSFEGPLSYIEICYVLAGFSATATPVTTSGVSTWTFSPNAIGSDSYKLFTLEQGDDEALEVYKDVLFTSLDIAWGLEDVTMSGNLFAGGRTVTEGGSLTSAISLLAEKPVSARDINIYCDTTYGGMGGTQLTDPFDAKLSLGEKYMPKWVLNRSYTSFKEPYEKISEKTFTITIEANSQGRTLLSDLTNPASTTPGRYFRVEASDGVIGATATNYSITVDFFAKLTAVREVKDYNDSLFAYEMTFTLLQESSLNKPYLITVKNALTSL